MMDDDMSFLGRTIMSRPGGRKEILQKKAREHRGDTGKVVRIPDSKVRVLIYKPVSYEDTQSIIDNLKEKEADYHQSRRA